MQFHDILNIPELNTQGRSKIEVAEMYRSTKDKCFNLCEKWNQGENVVGTTTANDEYIDTS